VVRSGGWDSRFSVPRTTALEPRDR
jgi:hypothetical protein